MIALIPARGGSKGLPGKNTRSFLGRPLIAWTIEAALNAKSISRVIVSTDSLEIAEVAKHCGADIPFMRPQYLAQDDSLAIDNYIYTIEQLRLNRVQINELVVLLPTSPLRTSFDIDQAVSVFHKKSADSVISYYEAPHPVEWYKYIDEKGVLRSVFPEGNSSMNRQSHRVSYLPNGAIYIFKTSLLITSRSYFSEKTYPYIMTASRSIDIDTIEDFERAEFYMQRQIAEKLETPSHEFNR